MRRFELTISVYCGDDRELPDNFNDWIYLAFGVTNVGASPTRLERVVETNHPPADDVVMRRGSVGSVYR